MKKLIRIVTATLLLAACVAAAAPTRTTIQQGLQSSPSPVPLCNPSPNCKMPVSPEAPAQQ